MIKGKLRTSIRALCAVAAVGMFTACGGGGSSSSATTTAPPVTTVTVDTLAPPVVVDGATATVEARDNVFEPMHLQIAAGTEVTFANVGRNQHDVIATDPSLQDFSVQQEAFEPGTKVAVTFDKPGTYAYYCSLHATATAGSMRGYITVTD